MKAIRVFFVGGLISYRALFNWISPGTYLLTMLGGPLFQLLFFTYLGRYSHLRSDSFFVVGNAVQASAMGGVYGTTMTIANERQLQTLWSLMATPSNRLALFLGRALPNVANGLVVSGFCFLAGRILVGFDPPAASLASIALVVSVAALSTAALGLVLGAVGLRARDVFFASNLVYFLLLLVCGVNVPLSELPGWLRTIARGVPLTHAIEAARRLADGASLGAASGLLWRELAIGGCYAAFAYLLFRIFELEARKRAALERM